MKKNLIIKAICKLLDHLKKSITIIIQVKVEFSVIRAKIGDFYRSKHA